MFMMHICPYVCWFTAGTPFEGNMCYFKRQNPPNPQLQLCEISRK
jgi:hypothetical protein